MADFNIFVEIDEQIWRMFFLSKWDTVTIAEALNVPEHFVWNRMDAARERRRGRGKGAA